MILVLSAADNEGRREGWFTFPWCREMAASCILALMLPAPHKCTRLCTHMLSLWWKMHTTVHGCCCSGLIHQLTRLRVMPRWLRWPKGTLLVIKILTLQSFLTYIWYPGHREFPKLHSMFYFFFVSTTGKKLFRLCQFSSFILTFQVIFSCRKTKVAVINCLGILLNCINCVIHFKNMIMMIYKALSTFNICVETLIWRATL